MSNPHADKFDAAIHRSGERKQAIAAAEHRREEARHADHQFRSALDALGRHTLELVNLDLAGRTLDGTVIRPTELITAVAAVVDTARLAGAWSGEWPEAPVDDPEWDGAAHIFDLVAAGRTSEALARLGQWPEIAVRLSDVANALYQGIDPLARNPQFQRPDPPQAAIPPCPGCGSPPAAEDVDDICPQCGAYHFRCNLLGGAVAARPGERAPLEVIRVGPPYWERIPPSQIVRQAPALKQAEGPAGNAGLPTAPGAGQGEATDRNGRSGTSGDPGLALLRVFTNGLAEDRIKRAIPLLTDDKLTVNEKLTRIDALIRFPTTASAEDLGQLLSVTKQAVLKTDWWIQNRKGEKENEIGRRRARHQLRAKEYEPDGSEGD
jgi:hypothetical protein